MRDHKIRQHGCKGTVSHFQTTCRYFLKLCNKLKAENAVGKVQFIFKASTINLVIIVKARDSRWS